MNVLMEFKLSFMDDIWGMLLIMTDYNLTSSLSLWTQT